MSLEDLGNIGEFVAAVAVVVSLLYLAVQIQQNTRSVRASTYHSVNRAARDLEMILAESEILADIYSKGVRDPETLSGNERVRFNVLLRAIFGWYEDIFFQYRQSTVSRGYWEARQRGLTDLLVEPGVLSWWREESRLLTDEFVSEVRRLQEQIGGSAREPTVQESPQGSEA